jgi:uncharacterized protein (TIGR03437 family)
MKYFTSVVSLLAAATLANPQTVLDFFDDSTLQDLHLTMSAADWQTLHDRYLDNTYYKCDFEWRGMTVQGAGLRARGTGSRNPIKPGLGIDFGRFNGGLTFLGLNSVVLRNFAEDPSMMHETLTMRLFTQLGLPYERTTFVRLFVNGAYSGLFEMVEPLDARYLRTRFGEDTGYLYEAAGGRDFHFQFLGDDPALYVPTLFDPKTHSSDPQGKVLADMIRAINQSTDAEFAEAAGKYLDLGAFVAHVAAEIAMAECDGILSTSGAANYYLYRRAADDHWFFLPWDKEMTFTGPDWGIWRDTDANVLLHRALRLPEFRKRYLDTVHLASEIIGGEHGWLARELEREYNLIHQAALEDPSRVCVSGESIAPCPVSELDNAVAFARNFASKRAEFLQQELAAAGWYQDSSVPDIKSGAVSNAATGSTVLAPGELASAHVPLPLQSEMRASALPLPDELAGIAVSVSGIRAPLISVSGAGVSFETPTELPKGPASVSISAHGMTTHTLAIEVRPFNPGIFALTRADGTWLDARNPAKAGDVLVIWATGLGPGSFGDVSGHAAPLDRLTPLSNQVSALVNGSPADVVWAGLAPGFVGLDQMIVRMPASLSAPSAVLTLTSNGEPGEPYVFPVQ